MKTTMETCQNITYASNHNCTATNRTNSQVRSPPNIYYNHTTTASRQHSRNNSFQSVEYLNSQQSQSPQLSKGQGYFEKLNFEEEPYSPRSKKREFRIVANESSSGDNCYSNNCSNNDDCDWPQPRSRPQTQAVATYQNYQNHHPSSAAVIRQLRDKFNVIDNNCHRSLVAGSPAVVEVALANRDGADEGPFKSRGSPLPLPSYGSAGSNHGFRQPPQNSSISGAAATMDNSSSSSSWSSWFQSRLPFLIFILLFLLCLFLGLSGALIYFKYFPSTKRLPFDEPCESTMCAFGASCRVESGRATCRCPDNCASEYVPVCGDDDVTYGNECLLRKYMCQHQKLVRIRQSAECNEPDPCEDKACLYGSVCVPSANGLYATCECPTSCPNYGDHSESLPVCGSDGKMHKNKCEMDRLACRLGRTITLKYAGKCDPCESIPCLTPHICHLDEERRPICHCGEVCSVDFNPVCGSDGKTYANECMMRQEACRSRRDLRIIYRGKCSSGVNPCESRTCRGYETCAINRFGIAQCTCAMVCDPIISPVCGSDGKTYDNDCQLMLSSCRDSRYLTVAYKGVCDVGSACRKHKCTPGARCLERNGEAICECPSCSSDYSPVCGSDGVSYQTECHLQLETCTNSATTANSSSEIQVMHSGLCNGCEKHRCEFYSVCELGLGAARCVCPTDCSPVPASISGPICGSDGVTYASECDLQKSSCRDQKFITIASLGHCDECSNVHCKFGAKCESGTCVCPTECPSNREPVCGTNLVTYMNECELRKTACRLGRVLNVHFYGDCSEGLGPFAGGGGQPTQKLTNESHLSGFPSLSVPLLIPHPHQHYPYPNPPIPIPTTAVAELNPCESIRCDFDALCELDEQGFPKCTCHFDCNTSSSKTTMKTSPICASDLKLYKNECEMQRESCQRQTELRPRPMELCEDTEIKPCYGDEPLRQDNGMEISCGNGPSRTNCPQGSFCHRTPAFAKCCKKSPAQIHPELRTTARTLTPLTPNSKSSFSITEDSQIPPTILSRTCSDFPHGCCEDETTAAQGPNFEGCPPVCRCNKLGSVTGKCDPVTLQCICRPGVGGDSCDRCFPGFWGLSRISIQNGSEGCKACQCSNFGSVRDDCEQMTGRCVCKPRVLGHKCNTCLEGEVLGDEGCMADSTKDNVAVRTCDDLVCAFGATCEEDGDQAGCACNIFCEATNDASKDVCATDGFTYQSECHVLLQSCLAQISLRVVSDGPCLPGESGTESPLRKWTAHQNTDPGDDVMLKNETEFRGAHTVVIAPAAMKSTRHLLPMAQFNGGSANHFYRRLHPSQSFQTPATIQVRSYLGDMCRGTPECVTTHSFCHNNHCACREGFYEDPERIQCRQVHSHLPGTPTCSKILCDPTSICYDHFNGSFTCVCPLSTSNYEGIGCVQKEQPIPFLNGKSRIALGKLAGYHKLSIEVEITPYLDFAHGVIIFSSQHANATGDFISLALIDGYAEFRYDLGDGSIILRSARRLISGNTYVIVAQRYNRDGLLRVNNEEDIVGTSPGSMKSLNLENGGFVGHIPLNSSKVWELVGTSNGFVGCLHKLKVGRRQIEFVEEKDPLIRSLQQIYQCPVKLKRIAANSAEYDQHGHENLITTTPVHTFMDKFPPNFHEEEKQKNQIIPMPPIIPATTERINVVHFGKQGESLGVGLANKKIESNQKTACSKKPCRNQGDCWIDLSESSDFRCVCTPAHSGKSCESRAKKIVETGAVLDFRGFSYLELPKIETGARQLSIELWVMLRSRNGLLMYSGQEKGKGDCIALVLSNGYVQFLFDLGSGMANITWNKPIALNKWHWIVATRVGREGKLQIDGQIPKTMKSPPALSELNLELPVYIGGIRDMNLVHRDLGLLRPFDGALQYVKINGETYYKEIGDALRRRLVHRNEGPPCGESMTPPCKNGGSCFPRLDSFACLCSPQFMGKTCEIRKTITGPVRFDGQNFLKFPRKITKQNKPQRRNRLEIVFRTTSTSSGVILWTGREHFGQLKRGYIGVFMSEGFLELRIDLGAPKHKNPVILRSKVNLADGRWHQVLVARRRRLIVFQVDGSIPQRATAPVGSNVLYSDRKIWIGGVAPKVLNAGLPPSYHQGFVGCIDLIRFEKRRLPLSKIAQDNGLSFCEDDD